ncbi:MAG: hypothetical protein ABF479_04875, partial [Gluconacetobacter sp.]
IRFSIGPRRHPKRPQGVEHKHLIPGGPQRPAPFAVLSTALSRFVVGEQDSEWLPLRTETSGFTRSG